MHKFNIKKISKICLLLNLFFLNKNIYCPRIKHDPLKQFGFFGLHDQKNIRDNMAASPLDMSLYSYAMFIATTNQREHEKYYDILAEGCSKQDLNVSDTVRVIADNKTPLAGFIYPDYYWRKHSDDDYL